MMETVESTLNVPNPEELAQNDNVKGTQEETEKGN